LPSQIFIDISFTTYRMIAAAAAAAAAGTAVV